MSSATDLYRFEKTQENGGVLIKIRQSIFPIENPNFTVPVFAAESDGVRITYHSELGTDVQQYIARRLAIPKTEDESCYTLGLGPRRACAQYGQELSYQGFVLPPNPSAEAILDMMEMVLYRDLGGMSIIKRYMDVRHTIELRRA